MKRFLLELGSLVSRGFNVLTLGSADIPFSARSHIDELWTEPVIDWFAKMIADETGHCSNSWNNEVERSQDNIDRSKSMKR